MKSHFRGFHLCDWINLDLQPVRRFYVGLIVDEKKASWEKLFPIIKQGSRGHKSLKLFQPQTISNKF
jgi:hypothetical protein